MGAWRISTGVFALGIALSSCAPPPLSTPPVPQPVVSTAFDGSYRGTVTLVYVAPVAQRAWCDTARNIGIEIRGGTLTLSQQFPNVVGAPVATYIAKVLTDATFSGSAERGGTISGKIDGRRLTADIEGLGCSFDIVADRS